MIVQAQYCCGQPANFAGRASEGLVSPHTLCMLLSRPERSCCSPCSYITALRHHATPKLTGQRGRNLEA